MSENETPRAKKWKETRRAISPKRYVARVRMNRRGGNVIPGNLLNFLLIRECDEERRRRRRRLLLLYRTVTIGLRRDREAFRSDGRETPSSL